ncbi:MAG: hypothetical protein HKP40_10060 [Litoreibacter sp.]|nr:hypothetical protein [Litoreibacter sp.]
MARKLSGFLPLQYASRGKRDPKAGLPFFLDNIGDDLLIILLAFVPLSEAPITVALAIAALHFSFWCIYEIGYYENDRVAILHERHGQVPVGFKQFEDGYSAKLAWAWGIALGATGVVLMWWSGVSHLANIGTIGFVFLILLWGAVLIALRSLFGFYNHVDKMSRVFVYLPLQLFKYAFPALFFVLPAAGVALIFAQIIRRWMPYVVYRYLGKEPVGFPARLNRFAVFAVLWLLLLPSNVDWSFALHGALIAAWLFFRGLSQINAARSNVRHVTEDDWRNE